MRHFKRIIVVALVVVLALFSFIEYANAQLSLIPWVRFNGGFQTTAGIGTGALTINGFVNEIDYENGDVSTANVAGIETIFGARVSINGATRTGDYSFNGVLLDPNDVTLTITTFDGMHTYLNATLVDVSFNCTDVPPFLECWLNEGLDANDPATLNLFNIQLSTNDGPGGPGTGSYPSRYIDELAAYLAASNVSGMKMLLRVPPVSVYDFTMNSSGPISFGLIDGLQSLNAPPVADAGATTSNITCLATSCEVILNGTQSTDPDGVDDIISYEWFENNILIASGATAPVTLPLGMHDVTLIVTDSAGETDTAVITLVIDPAELSFIEIDKAYVKRDGKIKIFGRLALPAGVSHFNVNSIGSASISVSDLANNPVVDEAVDFEERGNGNRWRYNSDTFFGLKKFHIDWSGSKFNYTNGPLNIKTRHIGEVVTSLEITSCTATSVNINGVEITIDENDRVTCPHAGVKVDGDDDGDSDDDDSDQGNTIDDDGDCTVRVRLPFALTPDMVIVINGTETVSVADYYTAAVGKFKIDSRFDASNIDFSSLVPNLELTVALGNEGFSATLIIDEQTWTKIKPKYWKYNLK